uniref:Uncharacterized protein n=1 Tax=Cannabis sativa TaxID=3483 RepID=A0A803PCR8_CANSA
MVNMRRTGIALSTSSSLPQDPQTIDHDVHVPAIVGIPMNTADVVNLVTTTGVTNLATTAGQTDTNIPVDLNRRSLPPTEDPSLAPPIEGRTRGRQS